MHFRCGHSFLKVLGLSSLVELPTGLPISIVVSYVFNVHLENDGLSS